jgi:hypothetical protein
VTPLNRHDQPKTTEELEVHHAKWEVTFVILTRALVILMTIAVAITTYFTVITLTEIERISARNNELNELTVKISQRLEDCTTPSGACYQESNARTGEAIGSINQITIIAAACADQQGVATENDIRKCIEQALKP